jgi:hypothetical protein
LSSQLTKAQVSTKTPTYYNWNYGHPNLYQKNYEHGKDHNPELKDAN